MALENCLQVSTACSATTSLLRLSHPFSSAEMVRLRTCKGLSKPNSPFSFSSRGRSEKKPLTVCKAREALDQVQLMTEANWDSLVLACEIPVLVEFWAPWCGPCTMLAPVIDELAKEYAGKIACYKVNTDQCPNIATTYGIRSIPTVLFFKTGERKETIVGAVPRANLSASIEKYI